MVEAETTRGLAQGGLLSATWDEVVFLAGAWGPGAHLCRGPWGAGLTAAVVVAELGGGGSIQAVLGGRWEPYQGWAVPFRSPTQRSGLGAGGRGQKCPRGSGLGAPLPGAEKPLQYPPSLPEANPAQSFPSQSPRHGVQSAVAVVSVPRLRPRCSTRRCCPPSEPPPAQTCAAAGSSGPWGLPPGPS